MCVYIYIYTYIYIYRRREKSEGKEQDMQKTKRRKRRKRRKQHETSRADIRRCASNATSWLMLSSMCLHTCVQIHVSTLALRGKLTARKRSGCVLRVYMYIYMYVYMFIRYT